MNEASGYAVFVHVDKFDAVFGKGSTAVRQFLSELSALGIFEEIQIPSRMCETTDTPVNEREGTQESRCAVPYNDIITLYHKLCSDFPKLRGLNDKRRRAIAARWREYGEELCVFEELFNKAAQSRFLCGANDRKWSATFDWLMSPTNMAKVLEGNFDNRKEQQCGFGGFDTDEFFEAAIKRGRQYVGEK